MTPPRSQPALWSPLGVFSLKFSLVGQRVWMNPILVSSKCWVGLYFLLAWLCRQSLGEKPLSMCWLFCRIILQGHDLLTSNMMVRNPNSLLNMDMIMMPSRLDLSCGCYETGNTLVERSRQLDNRFFCSDPLSLLHLPKSVLVLFGNLVGSLFFAAILVRCELTDARKGRLSSHVLMITLQIAELFHQNLIWHISRTLPCKPVLSTCFTPVPHRITVIKLAIPSGIKFSCEALAVIGLFLLPSWLISAHDLQSRVIHRIWFLASRSGQRDYIQSERRNPAIVRQAADIWT